MNTTQERLQAMRRDLAAELAADEADLARDIDDKGEDLTPSQHPADVASDLYAREELVADELAVRDRLIDVDDALGRIGTGTYGICTDCGQRIDPDRLAVIPEAQRCIRCQRSAERVR